MRLRGSTAVVRIGPGLFGVESCLFPYSLPFSDDLTDGTETGVLIFEVGAYEVDVPLCHVRRRMTEKSLNRKGVRTGPEKQRCGGVSKSVRRDRLAETFGVGFHPVTP